VHAPPRAGAGEGSGLPDYLVKWQCLPYADCTWEDGDLITRKFQTAIDEYNDRQNSQCIPSKYCKVRPVAFSAAKLQCDQDDIIKSS